MLFRVAILLVLVLLEGEGNFNEKKVKRKDGSWHMISSKQHTKHRLTTFQGMVMKKSRNSSPSSVATQIAWWYL